MITMKIVTILMTMLMTCIVNITDTLKVEAEVTTVTASEIKIDKNCEMLLEEISGYVWDSTAAKNGVEKPVKQNDHACDAMRYGWMHVIDGLELETGTNWAGGL